MFLIKLLPLALAATSSSFNILLLEEEHHGLFGREFFHDLSKKGRITFFEEGTPGLGEVTSNQWINVEDDNHWILFSILYNTLMWLFSFHFDSRKRFVLNYFRDFREMNEFLKEKYPDEVRKLNDDWDILINEDVHHDEVRDILTNIFIQYSVIKTNLLMQIENGPHFQLWRDNELETLKKISGDEDTIREQFDILLSVRSRVHASNILNYLNAHGSQLPILAAVGAGHGDEISDILRADGHNVENVRISRETLEGISSGWPTYQQRKEAIQNIMNLRLWWFRNSKDKREKLKIVWETFQKGLQFVQWEYRARMNKKIE